MFRPILEVADLPAIGTAREDFAFDMKAVMNVASRFEMAKDMAAFANASGGTILVGAAEDAKTGRLSSFRPVPAKEAQATVEAYSTSAIERCFPTPFVDPKVLIQGNGFVIAVNVSAFPSQLVGVKIRGDKVDGYGDPAYVFPVRSGIDTKFIRPDQLPMFMLPEIRRRVIMLESIPASEKNLVDLVADGHARPVVLQSVDILSNSFNVGWPRDGTTVNFALPIDVIRHVFKNQGRWRIGVAPYALSADGTVTL